MRSFARFLFVLILITGFLVGLFIRNYLILANGYNAKILCSCEFAIERNDCLDKELKNFNYLNKTVDQNNKTVSANIMGLLERKAIYRDGIGCTLLKKGDDQYKQVSSKFKRQINDSATFPKGDQYMVNQDFEQINYPKLSEVIDKYFTEPRTDMQRNTRAIMVYYKGAIVADQFSDGFTAQTPQLGWSMTKSITSTLAALMINDGYVSLDDKPNFEAWQEDERKNITLDHLLRMSSGLYFEEEYYKPSVATDMLFNSYCMADVAINQKLVQKPGTFFKYSSGTTNIVMKYLSDKLIEKGIDPVSYLDTKLFQKIGMNNSFIELDPAGYMAGSSHSYCSALDWMRYGILHLNKGIFNDEQILPAGWVKYVSTPTPSCDSAAYGAHFWLNAGFKEDASDRRYPNLPADLFFPSGHAGQHVFVFPSQDLIVLRLGNASEKKAWNYLPFLEDVLSCFESQQHQISYIK